MNKVLESVNEQGSEHLAATSIETTMICLVRFVRQLDVSLHALHMRTKLCHLVERMMHRRDHLAFRHEIRFRNKMVEYLTDWAMSESHQLVMPNTTELTAITRSLDQACMEAVAVLLRSLPLQAEESDRGDLMEAKSEMFSKYLTLFMNLMNATGVDNETSPSLEVDSHWSPSALFVTPLFRQCPTCSVPILMQASASRYR